LLSKSESGTEHCSGTLNWLGCSRFARDLFFPLPLVFRRFVAFFLFFGGILSLSQV
jgi:hypothetical protein